MKGIQCYELFEGIALKNHAFSFFLFFFLGSTFPNKKILLMCNNFVAYIFTGVLHNGITLCHFFTVDIFCSPVILT